MTLETWLMQGEELEKAATPGPWERAGTLCLPTHIEIDLKARGDNWYTIKSKKYEEDAAFIADSRTRVSKQREVIKVLVEALNTLKQRVDNYCWCLNKVEPDSKHSPNCHSQKVLDALQALCRAEELVK